MSQASGKFSYGLCDYCGQRYPYQTLRKNWKGFMVCPEDYEPKEPQLTPLNHRGDAIALENPRPDRTEPLNVFVNNAGGDTPFETVPGSMQPAPAAIAVEGVGSVGTVTITGATDAVNVSGVAATTSVGSVTVTVPAFTTLAITVANPGVGNRYYVDGVLQATMSLSEGSTYRIDQSDNSNSSHPLRFSTTSDGTHGGGSEYTTGVTYVGSPGSAGAYTQIIVAASAPTLYYYCTNHSGMGGQANTL